MFVKWKWIEANDLSGSQYFANKNKRFKSPMLGSDLYDYNDSYIVVKGTLEIFSCCYKRISRNKKDFAFKNSTPLGHTYKKLTTH